MVGIAGTNKSLNSGNQFYFFKADTSNFKPTPDADLIAGLQADDKILGQIFQNVNSTVQLKDFYTVSLWNYCEGSTKDNASHTDFCSKPTAQYWFDPVKVWGLTPNASNAIPQSLQSALNTYKTVTKWMFIAYLVAFVATAVELLLGFLAIFSRWGSFVTTLVAGVSALFTLVASSMATGIYGTLTGAFNTALKPYGIHGSLGRGMLATTWLAVAFAWAAALFWLFSTCCCSGRSNNNNSSRRSKAQNNTPFHYEMVGGPSNNQYTGHTPIPAASTPGTPYFPPPPTSAKNTFTKDQSYESYRHNMV
ncbi:MAG: hypothetical protein M1816_000413 [Peltula sp. TS41687]|nr:MAG: hypothetical protein M1816_000413 [Peltula sp. TS41687]